MMAIAPESLRAAMAMAVRVGAPRSHAFTFLRSPFGISLSKRPCNRFSPLPRWLKSSLHTTPALRFKPSYAVPVVSSVQDAMAKPVTKSAGLDLANEALDFTKSSQEGSSEESELEEGELAECKHAFHTLLMLFEVARRYLMFVHLGHFVRFLFYDEPFNQFMLVILTMSLFNSDLGDFHMSHLFAERACGQCRRSCARIWSQQFGVSDWTVSM